MAKQCVLICFLWIASVPGIAQHSQVIDSLERVLEGKDAEERFPVLYELVFQYVSNDNEKALHLAEQSEQAAILSGDSIWIVKSLRVRAQLLYVLGRIPEAILIATPLAEQPNLMEFGDEYFNVINLLGASHLFLSQFDKALGYYFQGYERAKEHDNKQALGVSLANVGLVYYKLKDYSRAAGYFGESQSVKDALGIMDPSSRMNVSLCYSHLGDYRKARLFLNESIRMCGNECGPDKMLHIKYASGCIFFGLKNYLEAETEFLESLTLSRKVGQTRLELDNIYMLTKTYIQRGDLVKAKKLLEEGESIVEMGAPFNLEITKMYEQLSELFLTLNNFKKAALYQSRYIRLKDSIHNEAVTSSLMRIESGYVEWKNHAQISKQEEIIRLKEEVITRETWAKRLSWILVLLIAILFAFLLKHYRRNKVINKLLDKKIAERTRELEVSKAELQSVLAQEKLRMRRISDGVIEKTNTLLGLCLVAQAELSDPVAIRYLAKIVNTSIQIEGYLKSKFKTATGG